MPTDIALKYYKSALILEAQENLTKLTISDYSNGMKTEDRKKFHKQIKKQATAHQEVKSKSVDDLESLVKGLLSGR